MACDLQVAFFFFFFVSVAAAAAPFWAVMEEQWHCIMYKGAGLLAWWFSSFSFHSLGAFVHLASAKWALMQLLLHLAHRGFFEQRGKKIGMASFSSLGLFPHGLMLRRCGRAAEGGVDHSGSDCGWGTSFALLNGTFSMLARGRDSLEAETDSLEAELRMANLGWHTKFLTWRTRPCERESMNMWWVVKMEFQMILAMNERLAYPRATRFMKGCDHVMFTL